jgi:hypothetical protein
MADPGDQFDGVFQIELNAYFGLTPRAYGGYTFGPSGIGAMLANVVSQGVLAGDPVALQAGINLLSQARDSTIVGTNSTFFSLSLEAQTAIHNYAAMLGELGINTDLPPATRALLEDVPPAQLPAFVLNEEVPTSDLQAPNTTLQFRAGGIGPVLGGAHSLGGGISGPGGVFSGTLAADLAALGELGINTDIDLSGTSGSASGGVSGGVGAGTGTGTGDGQAP